MVNESEKAPTQRIFDIVGGDKAKMAYALWQVNQRVEKRKDLLEYKFDEAYNKIEASKRVHQNHNIDIPESQKIELLRLIKSISAEELESVQTQLKTKVFEKAPPKKEQEKKGQNNWMKKAGLGVAALAGTVGSFLPARKVQDVYVRKDNSDNNKIEQVNHKKDVQSTLFSTPVTPHVEKSSETAHKTHPAVKSTGHKQPVTPHTSEHHNTNPTATKPTEHKHTEHETKHKRVTTHKRDKTHHSPKENLPEHVRVDKAIADAAATVPEQYQGIINEDYLRKLCQIESGCHINAVTGNAVGIAQFMPGTARAFGLVVNSGRDDRLDPEKAMKATVKLAVSNIEMFQRNGFSIDQITPEMVYLGHQQGGRKAVELAKNSDRLAKDIVGLGAVKGNLAKEHQWYAGQMSSGGFKEYQANHFNGVPLNISPSPVVENAENGVETDILSTPAPTQPHHHHRRNKDNKHNKHNDPDILPVIDADITFSAPAGEIIPEEKPQPTLFKVRGKHHHHTSKHAVEVDPVNVTTGNPLPQPDSISITVPTTPDTPPSPEPVVNLAPEKGSVSIQLNPEQKSLLQRIRAGKEQQNQSGGLGR